MKKVETAKKPVPSAPARRERGGKWSFWIDRGGTFTDIVALDPAGRLNCAKLLSENPDQYQDAALAGIRRLMGLAPTEALPAERIEEVRMGTTVGTNALLERRGEPVLLVTNRGHGDGLRIGYQNRPELFSLAIDQPLPLYVEVVEVDARLAADGREVTPLDQELVRAQLVAARQRGLRAAAIVFLHGYRYPDHERAVAAIAREAGFSQVSVSHQVSPLIKFVARGDTTVVDAYLSPVLRRYVEQVAGELRQARLLFMKSDGGLTDARRFTGRDCILSGPAGGVVGAVRVAAQAGFSRIIGFDMGGTSTDVCHYGGSLERVHDTEVAGVRMRVPMIHLHTVAAGGGSILSFDGSRCRVGPESAGADPGPACYRRGGPLTVTDANLMCGKILPGFFPAIFGPEGDQPLDAEVVRQRFSELADKMGQVLGEVRSPEQVADGFLAIAVANMATAIKKITIARGHDVGAGGYALVCFGGAAGQHACLVAEALGVERVMIHPLSGLLSAYGMGLAERTALVEQAVEAELSSELAAGLAGQAATLAAGAVQELTCQGVAADTIVREERVRLRYKGSDTSLTVRLGSLAEMRRDFEAAHRQRFGFVEPGRPLLVEALVVEARGAGRPATTIAPAACDGPVRLGEARFFSNNAWHGGAVYDRCSLPSGTRVAGPAVLVEPHATVVVEPGWQAVVDQQQVLVLKRLCPVRKRAVDPDRPDPVLLEIMNNLFMAAAEQMGEVLANTAHSVNIKERRDFSCALFDSGGNLVANAPHVPVHLGAMSETVKQLLAAHRAGMAAGDVFAVNDPYHGGSHLPDITVITPVFADKGGELLFLVACRGHHADIGGRTPGSMPPGSRHLEEEGVLLNGVRLVEKGRFQEGRLRRLLTSGRFPARNPDQNLADLKAQVAANEKGVGELRRLVKEYGLGVIQAYMGHVQANAAQAVRRVITALASGSFSYPLDNGGVIRVAIEVDKEKRCARIDFSGTSPQQPDNYNAPLAVVKAAVLYVFRCLVADAIPLNSGCLVPLTLVVPEGSLLNPRYPAAVVAGNVETSQAIVDALFGAMGVVAGSQGTMNNLTFGNDRWQYYETIAGGSGAGPGFAGASAVQTHMTNSRLTDPEVLESRFPVRLEEFRIRRASGGAGRWRGGDGVVRRMRFLAPMSCAILANNRRHAPPGLAGGKPGKPGRNLVLRADGTKEQLGAAGQVEMASGDVFLVETPGGGGYGKM